MSKCGYCGIVARAVAGPCRTCGNELSKVISLGVKKPHYAVFAMCLPCSRRWVGTIPKDVNPFTLMCPDCGGRDSFITFLPDDYIADTKP